MVATGSVDGTCGGGMRPDDVMAIREIAFGSPLYRRTVAFRDLHLRQPLGLTLGAVDLADEDRQIHVAALADGSVLGTVVLKPSGPALMKLRQMAVAPEAGRRGLGGRLIDFAEAVALQRGADQIELNARTSAQAFYEKHGYAATGPVFTEVTVPHVRMATQL